MTNEQWQALMGAAPSKLREAIDAHADGENHTLLANIAKLLTNVAGAPAKCKACGADIWWVLHKTGKRGPYTRRGLNHFADCVSADQFRKVKVADGAAPDDPDRQP